MHRMQDRYRFETAVGVVDVWVMREHRDGTVDVLCTCCGARWERVRVHLQGGPGGPPDSSSPTAAR
ncbi:hypothetical protein [Pseudonocardia zijingensis]|jgi:hypothetical protein|uniref:Zinc finger protein n=1 Tax=Pseudonocardia zijingensis TaxID=153376 RepID=A0ABN1PYI0_9PSEU